jgi:hypothetical protein
MVEILWRSRLFLPYLARHAYRLPIGSRMDEIIVLPMYCR